MHAVGCKLNSIFTKKINNQLLILLLLLLLLLLFHSHTAQLKFLTAGKTVVSGNNKLPINTKMFLFPVLYISNTFLGILADPSNADFWIKVIDVSTPMPFKLPFNRNGTVPKAPNTIGRTLVFTSHILLNSLARFWYFSTFSASFSFAPLSSGIATSIIWQLFLLLSTSTRSGLLASLWSVRMLKSQRTLGTGVGQASLSLSLFRECGRSRPPESGVTPLASVSNP